MKILMLVSLNYKEKVFNQGQIYVVDNDTARVLLRKRAAVIAKENNIVKKFYNKMMNLKYEVKNYDS
jgi:hypothetical protein